MRPTQGIDINLDLSHITTRMTALTSALITFAREFGQLRPDLLADADAALDEIAGKNGLEPSYFDFAKDALRSKPSGTDASNT